MDDAERIRGLIAARAAAYGGQEGYDQHGMDGWTDRAVVAGRYRPGLTNGLMSVDIGDGSLVRTMTPQDFSERYGQVPPSFGAEWLQMRNDYAARRKAKGTP